MMKSDLRAKMPSPILASRAGHAPGKRSVLSRAVRELLRNRAALLGLALLVIMSAGALTANWVSPYDPTEQDVVDKRLKPPMWVSQEGNRHLLGTDHMGRDILSRLIYGARISLMVGFLAVIVGTGIGAVVGLITGYFMGKLDAFVQRIVDMWMSFPDLILALTIVAVFGNTMTNVILAVAATILPRGVRVIRSSTLALRETEYVMAARAIGASSPRLILRHITPNTMAPFLIIMSSMFGTAILTEAGLSYLGLGIAPPTPSWGGMLTGQAAQYAMTAPWIIIFPGVALSLTVLGFAFAGDALRDIFDPKQQDR